MIGVARLELARPCWSTDFKSGVSTDSTTLPKNEVSLLTSDYTEGETSTQRC